jgi:hypothetical protein
MWLPIELYLVCSLYEQIEEGKLSGVKRISKKVQAAHDFSMRINKARSGTFYMRQSDNFFAHVYL